MPPHDPPTAAIQCRDARSAHLQKPALRPDGARVPGKAGPFWELRRVQPRRNRHQQCEGCLSESVDEV